MDYPIVIDLSSLQSVVFFMQGVIFCDCKMQNCLCCNLSTESMKKKTWGSFVEAKVKKNILLNPKNIWKNFQIALLRMINCIEKCYCTLIAEII